MRTEEPTFLKFQQLKLSTIERYVWLAFGLSTELDIYSSMVE